MTVSPQGSFAAAADLADAARCGSLPSPLSIGSSSPEVWPIAPINTFKGLPSKLSIRNGPTLSRDAGSVTLATTFFVGLDGSLTLVSRTASGEKGPHPDLDSGFEAFCSVIVPALT